MPEIDKGVCVSNIYALAKKKGLKISELETKAGVSAGYFSRLTRPENKSIPSVEVLDAVTRELGVLVDDLIHFNLGAATPMDEYVLNLLDFLRKTALNGDKHWEKRTEQQLYDMDTDSFGAYNGPLFQDYLVLEDRITGFASSFVEPGTIPYITGHAFLLDLDQRGCIYLFQLTVGKNADQRIDYELYVRSGYEMHPLCNGIKGDDTGMFSRKLEALYNAVSESCSHSHITPDIKEALDILMGLKKPPASTADDSDDLPF